MYHVDLDLSAEEVRQLRGVALSMDVSVKSLVTQTVRELLQRSQSVPRIQNNKKNIKEE